MYKMKLPQDILNAMLWKLQVRQWFIQNGTRVNYLKVVVYFIYFGSLTIWNMGNIHAYIGQKQILISKQRDHL